MTRWTWLALSSVGLLACEGREIAIFSLAQGGTAAMSGAGMSGVGGAAPAGAGGFTLGGTGGRSDLGEGGTGTAAGSGGTTDPPCQSNADCDSEYFCSKQNCGDAQGVCSFRPFPDDTSSEHVCGCDRVTYWNDSYRQRYGVAADISMGVCNRANCMHDEECKALVADAICGHLLPPNVPCGAPLGPGQCWIIPSECSTADSQHFLICPPLNAPAGTPGQCATTCQAIESHHPFTQVPNGQACP